MIGGLGTARRPFGSNDGQAAIALVGAMLMVFFGVAVFAQFGGAFVAKGRDQRVADLAATAAAKQMGSDYPRLFLPPLLANRVPNPLYLSVSRYRDRALATAIRSARANGAEARVQSVRLGSGGALATSSSPPTSVTVKTERRHTVQVPAGNASESRRSVRVTATATAELRFSFGALPDPNPRTSSGGGYDGPLAYRQGKPMRPDVAAAFDRMAAAARSAGHSLSITSGFRSDAEQSRLFAQNPNPKWVAPPGTSLHRYGTELDLGPPAAYLWLAAHARTFGFIKRYAWEPWHFGYGANPRGVPAQYERGSYEPNDGSFVGPGGLPDWVPARYRPMIVATAQKHNVQPLLLAAQLKAESNFNPRAVSSAGAQGIAQFIPSTARALGLSNPFDPAEAINAQGKLMSSLIRRFSSIATALAAYNAGPGAVIQHNGIPPYGETQAYIAKILLLMKGVGVELDDAAFAGVGVGSRVALVR